MKELDINGILSAMEKPATASNLKTVLDMLQQADVVLKQVESVMQRLDNMGLKPLIVRGLGVKLGIDAESPLKSAKSPTHEKFIQGINQLSEEELLKQVGAGANVQGKDA
jgi:3-deoxy-D-manno-octulosonic-acid transferase